MNGLWRVCGLVGVTLVLVVPARADDQAEAKAVIDKAIKAHGGAEVLAKFPAATVKMKGRYFGMGEGIDYTGSFAFQPPDRSRVEITSSAGGMEFTFIQVLKGDKAWGGLSGSTQELGKDEVAELRENAYVHDVGRLVPLTGQGYRLSTLGDVKVGDKPAVGVRVESKGHRDVNLFFDKDSGLLLKTETRAKDLMAGDKEFTAETFLRDYKKVGGMVIAHKVEVRRDGKLYVEGETTEFTPAEKLDDALFAKP